jgi:hypothetical protein
MQDNECLGTTIEMVLFWIVFAYYMASFWQIGLWAMVWSGAYPAMPWFIEWSPSLLWIAGVGIIGLIARNMRETQ